MAKQSHIVSINFTGGIISPGYLREVLEIASAVQVTQVRFGLRQQLYMEVLYKHFEQFTAACKSKGITFSRDGEFPNITSSYAAADIFINDSWLSEGIYKDIFDLIDYTPSLKINICDSQQTFMPFFTGHINWIASSHTHYWYLYIRRPGSDSIICWPELIYTNSIAPVSRQLESLMQEDNLHGPVSKNPAYISRPKDKELELPVFHLPYYEGFNKYNNSYWLGIYRRDEEFSVPFLKDVCAICLETGIGQLHATSWKSVIIKNIRPDHRRLWDYVLGKYNINVRHAANELNWQVPDNCEDSLIIKRHIIRHFDTGDVRTYGLCFSIKMHAANSHFGGIVIRRQENKYGSKLKYMQRFDILYSADFNPNNNALVLYREGVSKEHLGPYVISLCKDFYEKGSALNVLQHYVSEQRSLVTEAPVKMVHQCPHCFTVYDEAAGDPAQDVEAGTPFAALPDDYACYICDAPAGDFKEVDMAALVNM